MLFFSIYHPLARLLSLTVSRPLAPSQWHLCLPSPTLSLTRPLPLDESVSACLRLSVSVFLCLSHCRRFSPSVSVSFCVCLTSSAVATSLSSTIPISQPQHVLESRHSNTEPINDHRTRVHAVARVNPANERSATTSQPPCTAPKSRVPCTPARRHCFPCLSWSEVTFTFRVMWHVHFLLSHGFHSLQPRPANLVSPIFHRLRTLVYLLNLSSRSAFYARVEKLTFRGGSLLRTDRPGRPRAHPFFRRSSGEGDAVFPDAGVR